MQLGIACCSQLLAPEIRLRPCNGEGACAASIGTGGAAARIAAVHRRVAERGPLLQRRQLDAFDAATTAALPRQGVPCRASASVLPLAVLPGLASVGLQRVMRTLSVVDGRRTRVPSLRRHFHCTDMPRALRGPSCCTIQRRPRTRVGVGIHTV